MVKQRDKYSVEEEHRSHKLQSKQTWSSGKGPKKLSPKQKLCWKCDLYVTESANDLSVNEGSYSWQKEEREFMVPW